MGNKATVLEAGIVELATSAETVTGTDSARVVTPAGLTAAFAAPPSMGAVTATELNVATGTITASNPILDATQTWNNAGVTFTAHKTNITDTASASASLLADLQVGGSSKFSVRKDGLTNIVGDLDHDGTNAGFYGVTPAARPSALTQTYSTASATHSNPTATALTHTAVAGTTDGTLVDCTGTYSEAAVEENFKELAVAINNLITDVANVKQFLNQVVDQLQTLGLLQ